MASLTLWSQMFPKNIDLHGETYSLFPTWQRHQFDGLHGQLYKSSKMQGHGDLPYLCDSLGIHVLWLADKMGDDNFGTDENTSSSWFPLGHFENDYHLN